MTRHSSNHPPVSEFTDRISSAGAAGWRIADLAAEAIASGEDVLSLCIGDTSFDTPKFISDVAISSLEAGDTHYSPISGTRQLRETIAADQAKRDGNSYTAENVIVFAGAQNALFATMMCIAGVGDEVILFEPWYATYEACAVAGGANVRSVTLGDEQGANGVIDEAALRAAISTKTRAILLNAPNNPGGYLFGRDELALVRKVAIEHDLWVISDEVYRDMVFDHEFVSVSELTEMSGRLVIVNSLSKSHAMTGWRIGWTIASREMTEHLERTAQCMLFGSPPFIQAAAAAALSDEGDGHVECFRDALRIRRNITVDALGKIPELKFRKPGGGMFVFVDVSGFGIDGETFAQKLYDEAGVATVPGTAFGPRMTRFFRISFSGAEEIVKEGTDRIIQFSTTLRVAS